MPHKKFKFQYPKARYTAEQARERFFAQGLDRQRWYMTQNKRWWLFRRH